MAHSGGKQEEKKDDILEGFYTAYKSPASIDLQRYIATGDSKGFSRAKRKLDQNPADQKESIDNYVSVLHAKYKAQQPLTLREKCVLAEFGTDPLLHTTLFKEYDVVPDEKSNLANQDIPAEVFYLLAISKGVDKPEAKPFLQIASDRGSGVASAALVKFFLQDDEDILERELLGYIRRTLEQGYDLSADTIRYLYLFGRGEEEGEQRLFVLDWARKMAKEGDVIGLYILGELPFSSLDRATKIAYLSVAERMLKKGYASHNLYLTYIASDREKAAYYLRRAHEFSEDKAVIIKQAQDLKDLISKEAYTSENFKARFHLGILLEERRLLEELVSQNIWKFTDLAINEPWEKIKPLLDPATQEKVRAEINRLLDAHNNVLASNVGADPANIVLQFVVPDEKLIPLKAPTALINQFKEAFTKPLVSRIKEYLASGNPSLLVNFTVFYKQASKKEQEKANEFLIQLSKKVANRKSESVHVRELILIGECFSKGIGATKSAALASELLSEASAHDPFADYLRAFIKDEYIPDEAILAEARKRKDLHAQFFHYSSFSEGEKERAVLALEADVSFLITAGSYARKYSMVKVDQDLFRKGIILLERGAVLGSCEALTALGKAYLNQDSGYLNINKAIILLEVASQYGSLDALRHLVEIYLPTGIPWRDSDSDRRVKVDYDKALSYVEENIHHHPKLFDVENQLGFIIFNNKAKVDTPLEEENARIIFRAAILLKGDEGREALKYLSTAVPKLYQELCKEKGLHPAHPFQVPEVQEEKSLNEVQLLRMDRDRLTTFLKRYFKDTSHLRDKYLHLNSVMEGLNRLPFQDPIKARENLLKMKKIVVKELSGKAFAYGDYLKELQKEVGYKEPSSGSAATPKKRRP